MQKKSLAETHSQLALEWHPIKNGDLTPHDVTFGNCKRGVWWICPLVVQGNRRRFFVSYQVRKFCILIQYNTYLWYNFRKVFNMDLHEPTEEEKRRWWWKTFWMISAIIFGIAVLVGLLINLGIFIGMRIG